MIFLKHDDVGGIENSTGQASNFAEIDKLTVTNCVIDTLFVTYDDIDITKNPEIPALSDWDYDTVMNAQFNDNLLGGNVNFSLDDLDTLKIMRSEKDSLVWKLIGIHNVESGEDLSFEFFDYLARGEQDYNYALVPVLNGIEGEYNLSEIKSEFSGVWFIGKDVNDDTKILSYNAIMDVSFSTQANQVTSVVETLGRRYPYVNKYGLIHYDSGSINACFTPSDNCQFDYVNGVKYREEVENFLFNGLPKIIKFEDGRIWLAMITDAIERDDGDYYRFPTYTIHFTEIGRFDSERDLFNNGLIDVDPTYITEV